MGIKIYSYPNPYEIANELFWNEIKDCPHFCVSQTLSNGMMKIYPSFQMKQSIGTIKNLVNVLYKNWESINTNVKQIMEVDKAITNLECNTKSFDNVRRSLQFNTKSIVKCIRIFKELDIKSEDMITKDLNINQKYLIELYKIIENNKNSAFSFKHVVSEECINRAIDEALIYNNDDKQEAMEFIDKSKVVIHGIHQFSPAILCAIEDISKFKDVILLFNYQEQYSSIYKTWTNIYSTFDLPINFSNDNQFVPSEFLSQSYQSNLLADYIGRLSNGEDVIKNKVLNELEIIEFDNMMEFTNYVAALFDTAKRKADSFNISNPLVYMNEKLYSASGRVNDVLRAYFPQQFGERHFLDYPIGHFLLQQ